MAYTATNVLVDLRSALKKAAKSIMGLASNVGTCKELLVNVNELIEETLEDDKKQGQYFHVLTLTTMGMTGAWDVSLGKYLCILFCQMLCHTAL